MVVFKDGGSNQTGGDGWNSEFVTDFKQKNSHGKKLPHGHAEGDIFCGGGRECDFSLEFGTPDDGTSKQGEYKASARSHRYRILVIFVSIQTGKICIYPAVKIDV